MEAAPDGPSSPLGPSGPPPAVAEAAPPWRTRTLVWDGGAGGLGITRRAREDVEGEKSPRMERRASPDTY